MKIEASKRLMAAEWPTAGPFGLNGTYSTVFRGRSTANKFVQYLEAVGAKDIATGRRGDEYLIAWNKVFVDIRDWTRKGFPVQAMRLVQAGRETGEGAGALFYAQDTQKFLILLRADEGEEGSCWCGLGGGRDIVNGIPEDLETTVRRESFEEGGLAMDAEYELIHVGTKQYADGFKFYNYLGVIAEEFLPIINEEHKSFQWVDWDQLPKEMHRGMMSVFNSPHGQKVLKTNTTAFDGYR